MWQQDILRIPSDFSTRSRAISNIAWTEKDLQNRSFHKRLPSELHRSLTEHGTLNAAVCAR